ncbi:MAG: hypothetical protein D3923_12660 [Candidatus Electrothrix sp. AR3]|nr:hypothetical protein [Candidatus Electrothrix sp. AR3]
MTARRIKINWFLNKILIAILFITNNGCSNIHSSISNITQETPYPALTNLTETLKCMGQKINESDSPAILLLVDDFFDGTVPIVTDIKALVIRSSRRENGPLADAGKYDFEAIIKRSVSNAKIVIPYSLPNGLVDVDTFGRLKTKFLQNLAAKYEVSAIVRVKGIFTQNDASDYYNKGFGSGAGIEGNHGEVEAEYGISEASRSLSLAIHLGDPIKNIVGAATTLTLNTHTKSDEFSIGLGYGEGFMNFAKESRLREGLHAAQRTLIEAAAMWTLRGIYKKFDFSKCLNGKGPSPDNTVTAYQKWMEFDKYKRIKYLKIMLKELNYYTGKINKRYDTELQEAIISYEVDNHILIPHTKNSLGDLFILLYFKVDFDKIEKISKRTGGFI